MPDSLCKKIDGVCRDFWWRGTGDSRGMRWRKWEEICRYKDEGGLGFKQIKMMNQALLAKQGWRVITKPNSLLSRLYKARYFPDRDFMEARTGNNPSWAWRSMLYGRELLDQGVWWRAGQVSKLAVFDDPWIPVPPYFRIVGPRNSPESNQGVMDLYNEQGSNWSEEKLEELLPSSVSRKVLEQGIKEGGDKPQWFYRNDGRYTVASGYHQLYCWKHFNYWQTPDQGSRGDWSRIWKLKVTPRIRVFIWQLLKKCLAVKSNLERHGVHLENIRCDWCQEEAETTDHIFFQCPYAREVWEIARIQVPSLNSSQDEISWWSGLWRQSRFRNDDFSMEYVVCLLWNLWKARNELTFNGGYQEPRETVTFACKMFSEFILALS